jgi:RNA polymerase sigma factor (sigma-70 family)
MTSRKLGQVLTRLCAVAAGGNGGVSDAQLLDRFLSGGDEAAFELLVRRHERLVFGVCRRVLGQVHDAEDAFQATFLVLARRAASIAHGGAVASWLYKVAYRVALAARTDRTRRGHREKPLDAAADVAAAAEATCPAERADLRGLLDEELSRMPERFRAVAVLCYLEGKTVEEAARQLGCPRGTVASRLVRARARLRHGLTRRGIAVSAGMAAVALAHARAAARPPEPLIPATVRAAKLYGSVTAASAGAVPPRVAALTEGALRAMSLMKIKLGAAAAMFLAVLLTAGWVAERMRASAASEPPALTSARAENAATQGAQKQEAPARDLDRLQGDWELVRTEQQGKTTKHKGGLVWKIRGATIFAVNRQAGLGSTTSSSSSGSSSTSSTPLASSTFSSSDSRPPGQGGTTSSTTGSTSGTSSSTGSAGNRQPGQGGTTSSTSSGSSSTSSTSGSSSSTGSAVIRQAGQEGRAYLHLDAQASPKAIDLVRGQASGRIGIEHAIYKLEGDTLILCLGRPEGERPKEFRAAADQLFPTLSVFRRLKKTDARVKASDWDPAAEIRRIKPDFSPRGDLIRLQGSWQLGKIETVGKLATAFPTGDTWKITGGSVALIHKGKQASQGLLSVGVSGDQKTLDLFQGHADGTITVQRGVFQLQGDKLKIFLLAPDWPRPRGFGRDAGSSFVILHASRRQAEDVPAGAEVKTAIFVLKRMKAEEAVRLLRAVYRKEEGKMSVFIGAVEDRNAVVVRGPAVLLEEVEAVLTRLEDQAEKGNKSGR